MRDSVDEVIRKNITTSPYVIINHTLDMRKIVLAYVDGYKILYNNTITNIYLEDVNAAVQNGMYIKNMTHWYGINCDADIANCTNITKLDVSTNCKITTCDPFAKSLKILHVCHLSSITDDRLTLCTNIEELLGEW